jgi:broad specificity phosphatase PhoE
MSRCVETAEAIAAVWDVRIDERRDLRERAMGEWEGMLFRDLRRKFLDSRTIDDPFGLEFQPPGGESILDASKRVKPLMNEILEKKSDSVVVSHGGALSVILSHLIGLDIASARSFKFSNASVTELARNDWNVFVIESYNCLAHMANTKSLQGSFDGSNR